MQAVSKGLVPKKPRRNRKRKGSLGERDAEVEDGQWRPGPGMARKRRWNNPMSIGDSLSAVVWKKGWNENISLGSLVAKWPTIAGHSVAAHSQVESVEEGKILVRADSTAWAKQLQLLLPQIEKRIADELGNAGDYNVVVVGPKAPSWKHGLYTVKGPGPRDTYG